jgi:hypothetical protein
MITAKVCFTRQRVFSNHYRPLIKVREDMYNSCELIFINQESTVSGKDVEVYIEFLCPELVKDYLHVGTKFELSEGPINVGYGTILYVG